MHYNRFKSIVVFAVDVCVFLGNFAVFDFLCVDVNRRYVGYVFAIGVFISDGHEHFVVIAVFFVGCFHFDVNIVIFDVRLCIVYVFVKVFCDFVGCQADARNAFDGEIRINVFIAFRRSSARCRRVHRDRDCRAESFGVVCFCRRGFLVLIAGGKSDRKSRYHRYYKKYCQDFLFHIE